MLGQTEEDIGMITLARHVQSYVLSVTTVTRLYNGRGEWSEDLCFAWQRRRSGILGGNI
jgi:hypothetical protein